MPENFELPTRILFGENSLSRLTEVCARKNKPLLICGNHFLKTNEFRILDENFSNLEILSGISPEPDVSEIEDYWSSIKDKKVSRIIAIGGGSVLDAAKVLAAKFTNRKDNFRNFLGTENVKKKCLKLVAVPTTSGSGSEVTKYSVIKDNGIKRVVISGKIYPETAIVDPLLTLSASRELTTHTGIDALSHNLESYMSKSSTMFSEIYATEGSRLVLKWIEKSCKNGKDKEARRALSIASVFGGIAITNAPTGIVHLLSKILDSFNEVPHGLGNAVFLPYAMKYWEGNKLQSLEIELGIENLPEHLLKLNDNLGIPRFGKFGIDTKEILKRTKENMSLLVDPSGLGIKPENLERMIEECM